MSVTAELLRNAASSDKGELPLPPAEEIAVLACMDARLNPYGLLDMQEGDIRSAGGTGIRPEASGHEVETGKPREVAG